MIRVNELTKYYGDHAAIRNLTFDIERGEVIGFLGLNGAGKSTTLKILGCVLSPTSGAVSIDGFDVATNPHEIRKRIGFLPDTPPLYDEMSVGEYLAFVAKLRGVPTPKVAALVSDAEKKTGLIEVHNAPVASLSHGYRQRVGVAQAIVHQPKLLILDEPTSGLDPVQIVEMRELIRSLKGDHTILVSSHNLPEISQVCDRLLVISQGEIAAQGSEEELGKKFGVGAVELDVRGDLEKARAVAAEVPTVTHVSVTVQPDGAVRLVVAAAGDVRGALTRAMVNAGFEVVRLERAASRLEQIFLNLAATPEAKS